MDTVDSPMVVIDWRQALREIHDQALLVDWEAHLQFLNARLGLVDADELSTTDVGLAPAWFNGDIEAVEPRRWVLVVSLNPKKPPAGYYGLALTRDTAWEFWRTHNREWWYWRFFRPLVRMAAAALGESVATRAEPDFATERMVFVELCPYASRRFALNPKTVAELTATDQGFRTAARVRRLLIDRGHPALVLVNGRAAVADFELVEQARLDWVEVRYDSVDGQGHRTKCKQLWHKEGLYGTVSEATSIPVVSFPFLKKPMSHNSNAEIEQLGKRIEEFLSRFQMCYV